MRQPFFTIFTPVFNGEKHLDRVFESVKDQTFKDFEWIIVNDGSTDNTSIMIDTFIKNNPQIDIIYIEQSNSGKHIAWNKALNIARGQLFIPADADDYFIPGTLEFFYSKWIEQSVDIQEKISGINVLCFDNDTDEIVGNKFPHNALFSNNLQLFYKYKIRGEKWGCIRIDLLKELSFPQIDGSFYPEAYLWFSLAKKYYVICYNTPLRRYYTTIDSLTENSSKKKRYRKMAKVQLNYNLWFLFNFGFYAIRYSPYNAASYAYHIICDFLFIVNPFKK